ncbi:MAG: hypothetical protein DRI61_02245 [Chloroflexi bacterium]|nr:MAG: hypothetical protein DRI61_02245 [Chloroflexota bacterium]
MTLEEFLTKASGYIPAGTYFALLNGEGNELVSTLPQEVEQLALKIIKASAGLWDVGDYQVKSLMEGRRLFVFKISARWVLAMESPEKEGVLLHLARRLQNMFSTVTEEGEKSPEVAAVPSPPEAIPVLLPSPGKAVELRPEIVALLRAVDGRKNLRQLANETGLGFRQLCNLINSLVAEGLIELKLPSKPSVLAYELAPSFASPEAALPLAGPSLKVRTIILNLDTPKTIPQILEILGNAGIETDADDVKSVMRNLEARGIVRKCQ